MPSITVTRPATAWRDRARKYKVLLDGTVAAEISHGETTALEITPGPHEVRGKIDWCTTPPVVVTGDEELTLQTGAGNAFTAILVALFTPSNYLRLERAGTATSGPTPA